jgi:hypothetical protein
VYGELRIGITRMESVSHSIRCFTACSWQADLIFLPEHAGQPPTAPDSDVHVPPIRRIHYILLTSPIYFPNFPPGPSRIRPFPRRDNPSGHIPAPIKSEA